MSDANRRPLKVRGANLSIKLAGWLSKKDITPNQISVASVGFAILAAASLLCIQQFSGNGKWIFSLLSATFIQCRLLCNLFDGMVAVEGGKQTASGELFNDIPDRIADPIILVAAGYATGCDWGVTLGWLGGLIAVLTAYVRVLDAGVGAPMDFRGPMAKQHRMALMTGACVLTGVESYGLAPGSVLTIALLIVLIGGIITVYRRVHSAYTYLENNT
jgi:phosphatidylglycerophosphate synthase